MPDYWKSQLLVCQCCNGWAAFLRVRCVFTSSDSLCNKDIIINAIDDPFDFFSWLIDWIFLTCFLKHYWFKCIFFNMTYYQYHLPDFSCWEKCLQAFHIYIRCQGMVIMLFLAVVTALPISFCVLYCKHQNIVYKISISYFLRLPEAPVSGCGAYHGPAASYLYCLQTTL